jgi:hypothetical protein
MDFVRSKFGTNEPLPVEHFFPHFLAGLLCVQQTGQKVRKKVFICTEVTSYKIHTLVLPSISEGEKVHNWQKNYCST